MFPIYLSRDLVNNAPILPNNEGLIPYQRLGLTKVRSNQG